jgi:ABC transporter substrate binding protein
LRARRIDYEGGALVLGIGRREFIILLGGSVAAAWPLAARAEQPERLRRVGVLMNLAPDDPESPVRLAAFLQGMQQLGWTDGHNVRIYIRWATTDAAEIRRHAAELAALAPDVILAQAATTVGPLLQATRTVPVVFPSVVDPVGAGFVAGSDQGDQRLRRRGDLVSQGGKEPSAHSHPSGRGPSLIQLDHRPRRVAPLGVICRSKHSLRDLTCVLR